MLYPKICFFLPHIIKVQDKFYIRRFNFLDLSWEYFVYECKKVHWVINIRQCYDYYDSYLLENDYRYAHNLKLLN